MRPQNVSLRSKEGGWSKGWGERMWKWQKLKGNYLSQIKHQRFPFSSITVRASEWMNEPQNEERNRRTNEYKSIKISQLQYMRCLRERERARVCEGDEFVRLFTLSSDKTLRISNTRSTANVKRLRFFTILLWVYPDTGTKTSLSPSLNETNEFLSENLPLHSFDIEFILFIFLCFYCLNIKASFFWFGLYGES